MTVAGIVLAVGHYTRYKPGLTWIFTTTTLLLALGIFEWAVGFDELDYQFYVARNNPEDVTEFREHSIREALDETVNVAIKQKDLQYEEVRGHGAHPAARGDERGDPDRAEQQRRVAGLV